MPQFQSRSWSERRSMTSFSLVRPSVKIAVVSFHWGWASSAPESSASAVAHFSSSYSSYSFVWLFPCDCSSSSTSSMSTSSSPTRLSSRMMSLVMDCSTTLNPTKLLHSSGHTFCLTAFMQVLVTSYQAVLIFPMAFIMLNDLQKSQIDCSLGPPVGLLWWLPCPRCCCSCVQ